MDTIMRSVLLASFAFFTPLTAHAQHPDTAEQNEDIVVTGGKRETTLQVSDLLVTVLDAEAIRETRLRDVSRIDELVPNVQFNEIGQLSSVFVPIRGVESNPFIVNRAARTVSPSYAARKASRRACITPGRRSSWTEAAQPCRGHGEQRRASAALLGTLPVLQPPARCRTCAAKPAN
jgi:outer membrane receptor for ferrienterochelin and colicin